MIAYGGVGEGDVSCGIGQLDGFWLVVCNVVHNPVVYGAHHIALILRIGRLNTYLADIDRQAQERFEILTEQMKQAQGITEQLKVENTLEWVGRMNNIRACAMEVVNEENIYN